MKSIDMTLAEATIPLVSVIIPVFNVRPYLNEALESVISQTYNNLEILIIDDGSTDGSGEICDDYRRDTRVKVIHQENKGLSVARNVGLDMMTGDIVAFCDPDDKYMPDYVFSMLKAMKHNNVDLVICKTFLQHTLGVMKSDPKGESIYPSISKGLYDRTAALRSYVGGSINPGVWNKLYKARLWNDIRFPIDRVYEDVVTLYSILECCKSISVIDEVLYLRRGRPGSITSTHSLKNYHDYTWAFSIIEHFIEEDNTGLFNQEHLRKIREKRLIGAISCYVVSTTCDSNIANIENVDCKEMKEQIITIENSSGIIDLPISFKVAYYLIRYCPWLLRIVYPVYQRIRSIQRKVIVISRKCSTISSISRPTEQRRKET